MSHVVSVECRVRDLATLREAARRIGLELVEGQRSYRWYGRFLNDWPSHRAAINRGEDPATFGRCDHVLRRTSGVSGDYEIGVREQPDGSYRLVYDTYGGSGMKLEQVAGEDCVTLRNECLAVTAEMQLAEGGYWVERQQEGNRIVIVATA